MPSLRQLTTRGIAYDSGDYLATVDLGSRKPAGPVNGPSLDPNLPFAAAAPRMRQLDASGGPGFEYGCFDLSGLLIEDPGVRFQRQHRNILYYTLRELFNVSRHHPGAGPGAPHNPDPVPKSPEAQWAVVLAETCPDATEIRARLRPLIQYRKGSVITLPPGDPPAFVEWLSAQLRQQSLPAYLLLCGDLEQIPLEYQFLFNACAVTGRLWFRNPARFGDYAQKVMAQERTTPRPARSAIFSPCDDPVMASDRVNIIDPILAHARIEGRLGDDCSKKQLVQTAPDLRFLALYSHGLALRETQLGLSPALQGAHVLDFANPQDAGLLLPDDIATGPVVPGGIVFSVACLGGGNQNDSDFAGWIDRRALSPYAQLPSRLSPTSEALLANPDGPVATVMHFDISVSGAQPFENLAAPNWDLQMWCHYGLMSDLQRGETVGRSTNRFRWAAGHYYAQAIYLFGQVRGYLPVTPQQAQRPIWQFIDSMNQFHVAASEMRNFLIMGDPAVRLPPITP